MPKNDFESTIFAGSHLFKPPEYLDPRTLRPPEHLGPQFHLDPQNS